MELHDQPLIYVENVTLLIRYQLGLFLLTILAALAVLLPKVWALRSLYVDSTLRSAVQSAVENAAAREGWLLSDLSIDAVESDSVRVTYRAHRKGPDPESCHAILLGDSSLRPCDAEQN